MNTYLDTKITGKLKREYYRNVLCSQVNKKRKNDNINEKITIYYKTGNKKLKKAVREWYDYIIRKTNASNIIFVGKTEDKIKDVNISIKLKKNDETLPL